MLKFLGGGATFIQGGTSIPESTFKNWKSKMFHIKSISDVITYQYVTNYKDKLFILKESNR